MSSAEHIFVISMGRPSDIMLEDTIAAEGYKVTHIPTLQEGLAKHGPKSCSAVVFLAGRPEGGQVEALLREATEQLPTAKFLVAMDDGAPKAISTWSRRSPAGCCGSRAKSRFRRTSRRSAVSSAAKDTVGPAT